ncbi:unnamed protein product [Fraxinus pennsylvanica]|uniref:Uncharacterized protein n=1 Tax=Fraxinus pennsylvanica TaxID=56036 RepID=A0AAD1Z6A2_9LAMI|nr:unnamed protein product [Fraxinus pennsylvanica]
MKKKNGDAKVETGCWIKLRYIGSCISSRSKVDSPLSGVSTHGEDNVVILVDHVRALLEQGNALDCVDPNMGNYLEEDILPILKLALVCTSQIPSNRPSMAEVVQILQVISAPVPQRL